MKTCDIHYGRIRIRQVIVGFENNVPTARTWWVCVEDEREQMPTPGLTTGLAKTSWHGGVGSKNMAKGS